MRHVELALVVEGDQFPGDRSASAKPASRTVVVSNAP
jgi:hypothetical protein